MQQRPLTLYDPLKQPHVLEVGQETLMLDSVPATVVALEDDHVTLGSSVEVVTITYAALGQALVGDRPTLSDVGQLLAHYLARWSALHQLSASLAGLQGCLGQVMTQARPWLAVPLPAHRFDEVTSRVLDAFDGTEELTRTLARILGQSPETIVSWAQQLGKTIPDVPVTPSNGQMSIPELAASCMQIVDAPVAVSSGAKSNGKFHWNAQQEEQLTTDFLASTAQSVAASVREIADRYGWPTGSVQSKLYELELPQRKRTEAAQREARSPAQEDHSSPHEQSGQEQDGVQA
ncbi:MAG TPA: hypothetical protein VEL31_31135 [Ktedonobacteraceae bacterium]|nr:hypothetical protein [Ktedonobacteraceae bacterium]